jgi:hypothetical protein
MELKPLNDNTDTIVFSMNTNTYVKKEITKQKVHDPKGVIPTGIFGVIR